VGLFVKWVYPTLGRVTAEGAENAEKR